MLVELGVAEQRYRAVLEVLDEGATVTDVARRYGVARQTVHGWLRRYVNEGGLAGLADRPSRPQSCPHQMSAAAEARVLGVRRAHPAWGPSRIVWQLERDGIDPVPGRSSVYRALVRHGLVEGKKRKRRREDYRRWERGRAMELWQMDVMGRVHLAGGLEVKVVTGIDDHSRFVVCAKVVLRATARPVCQALSEALARHGLPSQILTDNGKVFTARFGTGPGPVLSGPDLRGQRHQAPAHRPVLADDDGEGGAAAQDDAAGVLHTERPGLRHRARVAGGPGWVGGGVQHRPAAPVLRPPPAHRAVPPRGGVPGR